MKQTLLSMKNKLGCKNHKKTTLLSLLLTCSLTACGGSDDTNEVDDTGNTDNIVETNTPPIANAGADQTAFIGSVITLSGSESSDADGDVLSYSWSLSTLPNGSIANLSNTTDVTTSFSADIAGTYIVTLTVNDEEVTSEVDTIEVIVSDVIANTAPLANAGADQTVFVDSTVVLSGEESSDADGDSLTYSWSLSVLPDGSLATLSSDTDVATSFSADVVGLYVVSLMVNDTEENSEIDSVDITVSEVVDGSTTGVLCDYSYDAYNDSDSVQLDSTVTWSCTDEERDIIANGVPDHAVGTFPNNNNPNAITEQSIADSFTLTPVETSTATTLGGPAGVTGYVLNGVKIDAATAGSCDDSANNCSLIDNSGSWHIEALGHNSFDFGTDDNNAHVQPGGTYHYHGMPEGFITKQDGDDTKMTIIGWAADGFPIYARYGYTVASDSTSAIKAMTGSYQLKSDVSTSRPSTETYTLGTFAQDWEYIAGSGDLDECNGRVGVTPEFPQGIYHYYATDTYPYFQRCVTGEVESAGGPPPR